MLTADDSSTHSKEQHHESKAHQALPLSAVLRSFGNLLPRGPLRFVSDEATLNPSLHRYVYTHTHSPLRLSLSLPGMEAGQGPRAASRAVGGKRSVQRRIVNRVSGEVKFRISKSIRRFLLICSGKSAAEKPSRPVWCRGFGPGLLHGLEHEVTLRVTGSHR